MKGANKKAQSSRARKGRGRMAVLPRVSVPPPTQRVLCTFAAQLAIAESAAGSGVNHFFRLNSLYDPDASGVGATAIGYNTWSALFLNYKVRRVTARIQGTVTGLSTGAFASVVVAPLAAQAVVPSNKQTWKLIPGARLVTVANNGVGGKNMVEVIAPMDNAKIARVTKEQYENDMDFSGQVGSNPSRQNYLMISLDSVGSSSVATLSFNIQITYETEWFNPVPLQ